MKKGETADGRTIRQFDKRAASAYLTKQFQRLWSQKKVKFDIDIDGLTLNIFAEHEAIGFTSITSLEGKHSKTLHKSFDCTIMDVADDIAFGIHDLEDALELQLIGEKDFRQLISEEDCGCFLDVLKEKYSHEFKNNVFEGFVEAMMGEPGRRKRFVNRLVHHFITHCVIETDDAFADWLLRYKVVLPEAQRRFLDALTKAVALKVIRNPSVQHLEFKGQGMVVAVFEALASDPEALLPAPVFKAYSADPNPVRVICDHVAGMTDMALMKTYERLFSPGMGSVFDMH